MCCLYIILQASGGKGGAVHVWDAETNAHVHKFTGHRDTVSVSMHNMYLTCSSFVAFALTTIYVCRFSMWCVRVSVCLRENVFCFLETQKINKPIECSNSYIRVCVWRCCPFLVYIGSGFSSRQP